MRAPVVGLLLTAALTVVGAAPATAARDTPRAVGVRTETLVDPSRGTAASSALGLPAEPQRTLPVTVWYPARGAAAAPPTPGARPAHGRFPLILYAPGNGAHAADAPALVTSWASHGYVIVAPDFPVSSRARTNLDAIDDWSAQPGDVRFVLDHALSRRGIAGLGASVDRDHVGLAGHSLGAITVLAAAFGTDPDPRVDAVVTFSGVPLIGGADVASRALPLLLVHGDDDPTIPADQSRTMFDRAAGPRGLVIVAGGGHSTYLRTTDPTIATALATATDRFWDAALRTGTDPTAGLAAAAVPGRVTVETSGPVARVR